MSTKPRVLLVDDDERLLTAAKRILHKHVALDVAVGGKAALAMLNDNDSYAVLVSDQNMPDMKGADLLEEVSTRWPTTTRIMLTGNNDLQTAVSAVNSGHIFRFLNKPCQPEELLQAIQDGERQHRLLTNEKALLEGTLSGSVKVLVDVLALSNPEAFQRASQVRKFARVLNKHMEIPRFWEFEVASMLWPLGLVSLPATLASKAQKGDALTKQEQAMFDQSPQAARDLIKNVPRMENVAKMVYFSKKGFDGTGFPYEDVKGENIPKPARLLKILIDLVHTKSIHKTTAERTFEILNESAHLYDLALLAEVQQVFEKRTSDKPEEIVETSPDELKEGDVIAVDIMDDNDQLLLSTGNELTGLMIRRLRNMRALDLLSKNIMIKRSRPLNASEASIEQRGSDAA